MLLKLTRGIFRNPDDGPREFVRVEEIIINDRLILRVQPIADRAKYPSCGLAPAVPFRSIVEARDVGTHMFVLETLDEIMIQLRTGQHVQKTEDARSWCNG